MADSNLFSNSSESKCCLRCEQFKPLSDFGKSIRGVRPYCKSCHSAMAMEWAKNNREKRKEYFDNWRSKNKEKIKQYAANSYRKMSAEAKAKKYAAAEKRRVKKLYGITWEEYSAILEKQGGVCAICQIPGRTGRWNKLVIDHCHDTGRVRGLLCAGCNVSIAALGDNEAGLLRALNHIRGEL